MSDNKEVFLKFVTSCTKDDAVARMLGWMQGPVYDAEPELTEDNNVPLEYLPTLSSLPNSLEEQLTYLVGEATKDLDDAKASRAGPDVIKQKEATLRQCFEWINKAGIYLPDIVDELAKGESSALRVDQVATEKYGVIQITTKSLDEWALKNYQIQPRDLSKPISPTVNQLANSSKGSRRSTAKLDNLHITFAYLIEAFIKDKPKYSRADKVNVSQLANFLSRLASNDNSAGGQGIESIKARIEESIQLKNKFL